MGKRPSIFLKMLVGLLLIGLSLYSFRQQLLETLLVDQLRRLGVSVRSLTVEEISLNKLGIGNISLGAANELRAEKIHAEWTFQELLKGELQAVEISGLQLLLDLTEGKPPLGSLQQLIEYEGNSGNNKTPQVSLLDAKVILRTSLGDITVGVDGGVKPGLSGKKLITLNFEAIAKQGRAIGELTAVLGASGNLHGQGFINLKGLGFAEKIANLDGNIVVAGKLVDGSGKITLAEGCSIEASGLDRGWIKRLGIPALLISELKQNTKLHVKSTIENSAELKFGTTTEVGKIALVTGLEFAIDKAQADISAQANITLSQQNQVAAFKISELDVVSTAFKYTGNIIDRLTLSGSLQGTLDAWEGELDLAANIKRFRVDQLDARNANVVLPMRINFKDQSGLIALRTPGQMRVGKLMPFESSRIKGPVKFSLPKSDIRFTPESSGLSLENRITIHPDNVTLLVNRDDAPAREIKIHPGKIVHTSKLKSSGQLNGKSVISTADITLLEHQIQLKKTSATIYHGKTGQLKLADFRIGQLQHLAPKPYFAPISLAGNVKLKRKNLSVNATGGIPGKQYLKIAAEHGFETGAGSLKLDVIPLTFSPGTLQPAALFPGLSVLESVSGNVSASNHVSWSKQGIKSGASVDLQKLSFTQNGTTISNLSASLELTDLLSPESLPQQKITIQRVDPGVAMENMEVIYQIQGTDSPQIAIDKAQLSVIGGTLSTGSTIIDPLSNNTNMVVQVADLDLGALFNLIDVEGLTGGGRLDGSIPLTISGDAISIQNGELAAEKPGILYFKSEKLSQILAGRTEDVDLLLQALTEFHYTELALKLNNSVDNDLVVTLSLLGSNPNVLKGRPFRLNINLESNINGILKALAQSYGLSNKAIQRALRLK